MKTDDKNTDYPGSYDGSGYSYTGYREGEIAGAHRKYIEESIDIDAPVSTVYNQWTQFEEFPHFMEGIKSVRQLDDKHIHWCAEIAGKEKEWDAEILEQIPDERITWQSLSGTENFGSVSFMPLEENRTRLTVRMGYDPEGAIENIGAVFGVVSMKVSRDLKRFKDFIESRGVETGGWRGEIHGGTTEI
jgi:uncharacterized membrane protein